MNWLAHIFLSEQQVDFQIANFLADPLKGRVWKDASIEIEKGMFTHKIIDSYTDAHEIFKKSKNTIRDKGLLRAIIIDITYDYFLTKHWNTFCNIDKKVFIEEFYEKAKLRTNFLSPSANEHLSRLIDNDVLNRYQSVDKLKISFEKLDLRLSKRLLQRDTASSYFDDVFKNIDSLEEDFLEFFPQLCLKVKQNVNKENLSHWRI